jgi:hypothetical protein
MAPVIPRAPASASVGNARGCPRPNHSPRSGRASGSTRPGACFRREQRSPAAGSSPCSLPPLDESEHRPARDAGRSTTAPLKADVSTGLELALAPDELRARRPGEDDDRNGRTKQARAGRQIGLLLLVRCERLGLDQRDPRCHAEGIVAEVRHGACRQSPRGSLPRPVAPLECWPRQLPADPRSRGAPDGSAPVCGRLVRDIRDGSTGSAPSLDEGVDDLRSCGTGPDGNGG